MKKILVTITFALCAIAFSVYVASADTTTPQQPGTQDGHVVCQCAGFLGNDQCKASNNKDVCASGDNIQCQDWNGNC